MLLNKLLKAIQPVQVTGESDIEITGINIDSRLVEAGQLFMAMRGTQADGHAYIPTAIEKGAVAVLCEDMPEEPVAGITYIQVKDSEDATGKIATTFYGDPTSKMELVGVTGTNGKTTIATLLYNTFRYFGYKVGLISTVCNYIDGEAIPTDHTTPDPVTLHNLMARMVEAGFHSDSHIIMFPAGICSRRQKGVIKDLPWKKTFVTKSVETHRDVVPVHFDGRNSNFFYNLANACKFLGIKFNIAMLYLADEMFKNRHKTFKVTIGKPIPWQTFDKSRSSVEWADYVRELVYKL